MTILNEFVGRDGDWLSLSGAASVSPRGSSGLPTAARFLYTDAQVTEFQTRMSGAGPFYSTGQGFYGAQANAPGDGARALTHADAFIANPTGDNHRFTITVPLASGNPEPPVNATIRPMRAAWCALTLPSHANAASWRSDAKDWLLWASTHANHDFSDNTKYPVDYPGWYPNPIFRVGGWVKTALKTYDMLGRDEFTQVQLDALDRWFYGYANWALHHFEGEGNNGRIPNLTSGNYSSTDNSGLSSYVAYNGGAYISNFGMFTNRAMACFGAAATIANYLKFHNVTPGTGGTQPSYGWWTVDFLVNYAKYVTEAWLKFSLHPDGWTYDFHRAQHLTAAPSQGWAYASNEIIHLFDAAHNAAHRGDTSLWDATTTAGHINTEGVPVAGGFAAKSLHYAAWMYARYVNDGWGRVVTGSNGVTGPLAPSNAYRDVINSAVASKKYPGDDLIMSSWTRVGNSMPGYPSSPESQGEFSGWDGEMGSVLGLIEVGGV